MVWDIVYPKARWRRASQCFRLKTSATIRITHISRTAQNEILTSLARIADLKAIGRGSATQYKSGEARDLRKIGRQLGWRMYWKEVCSVPAIACASTRTWSMRAATGSYGDRAMTGTLRTCSQFKAKLQWRLPMSFMPNSCQMKRTKSNAPRQAISPLSIFINAPETFF